MANVLEFIIYILVALIILVSFLTYYYSQNERVNYLLFIVSIITVILLIGFGAAALFINNSVYGALISTAGIAWLFSTRLRLLVYRYQIKRSMKRIVALSLSGKRVAFIAADDPEIRQLTIDYVEKHLSGNWCLIYSPLGIGDDKNIDFITERNEQDTGYLIVFMSQTDSYSWLSLIAGDSPDKAIAFNFDYIPDMENTK